MNSPNGCSNEARAQEAALWHVRLLDAPLRAEDQIAFERWLDANEANGIALDEAARLWLDLADRSETAEMLALRSEALAPAPVGASKELGPQASKWVWRPARIAALCASIAAVLTLAFAGIHTGVFERDTVIRTAVGERRVFKLEDGSRVLLDGDSQLSYGFDGSRRRLELLRGRARFDVARDVSRPFSVTAGERTVIATGTSFSVERISREVHVILYQGHVAVVATDTLAREGGNAVVLSAVASRQMLSPGHELIARDGTPLGQVMSAKLDETSAWEQGVLDFRDEMLGTAAERMNRYSKKKLIIDDSNVAKISVNGVFHAGDVDALVSSLVALYPVTAKSAPDGVHLGKRTATPNM